MLTVVTNLMTMAETIYKKKGYGKNMDTKEEKR